jgi:hypothetical protein
MLLELWRRRGLVVALGLTICCGTAAALEPAPNASRAPALTGVANAEIKVTVRADQITLATTKLKLAKSTAERRWVTFYDTRALDLFKSGLVLRTRKVQDGKDDSTVKLRPIDATKVAPSWFSISGFKCEEDWNGASSVTACSLSDGRDKGEIDDVAAGKRSLKKLYNSDQERFVSTYATRAPDYARLAVLGPADAWVQSVKPADYAETIDSERWELPDGTAILELSIRVPLASAAAAQRAFITYLEAAGLDTSRREDGKTRLALEYFSKH